MTRRHLYLVVDGPSDAVFWTKQARGHYPGIVLKVHDLNRRTPAGEFDKIIADAKDMNYDYVLFLTDEDADPDPRANVTAIAERIQALKKDDPTAAGRVKAFGVCRGLEGWLLSDAAAINRVFPRADFKLKGKTDSISDCKGEVQQKVYKRQYGQAHPFTEREFAGKMACQVNFDRAAQCSDSLASFWASMRHIFGQTPGHDSTIPGTKEPRQ